MDLSNFSYSHIYWIFLLPLIGAGADIVTGWIQATINGTWDSTKMRKGLYRKGGLDGQFGPATEEAVRAYQDAKTKAGANIGGVDGIVGTKTWGDLLGVAI